MKQSESDLVQEAPLVEEVDVKFISGAYPELKELDLREKFLMSLNIDQLRMYYKLSNPLYEEPKIEEVASEMIPLRRGIERTSFRTIGDELSRRSRKGKFGVEPEKKK